VHHGRLQERLYGIWHNAVVSSPDLKHASADAVSIRRELPEAPQPRFTAVAVVRTDVWAVQSIGRDQTYIVVNHSHDNGLTWQAFTLNGGAVLNPSAQISVSFKDSMQGELALSTGERWQTADGGAHWTIVK